MRAMFTPEDIDQLKREARLRKRERGFTRSEPRDEVAREKRLVNWALLMKHYNSKLAED